MGGGGEVRGWRWMGGEVGGLGGWQKRWGRGGVMDGRRRVMGGRGSRRGW